MTPIHYMLFWIVAAALFLLPGGLLARRFPLLWSRLGPGERILPAFLLSALIYGLVYLLVIALHPTLRFALILWMGLTAGLLLWNVLASAIDRGVLRKRARAAAGRGFDAPGVTALAARLDPPGGPKAWLWAVPILLFGWIAMLVQGGSLGYVHDSLDFAGFVNRMLLTGRCDLASGAFADSAGLTPDPRRGSFHLAAALLCRLSGTSAVEMWRAFPSFLVPLALWIFYASMRRLLQSSRIALVSLAYFVALTFFTADHFINNLAYASRLGWVYSWVGLWAVALYLDREREDHTPPPDWRARFPLDTRGGRAALALAVLCALVLLGIHVLSSAQYLISLGAFCWTWSLARAEPRPVRRTLAWLPLAAAAALLPLLVLKLRQSYSSANPLFDHPQGLLYLGGEWATLSPPHIFNWFGWPGLFGIAGALPLIPRFRRERALAFLVGSTLAPLLIVLNPLAIRAIEGAKAHSLLFRVLLVTPYFQVLGWWTVWAARTLFSFRNAVSWRSPRLWRRVLLALLFLVVTSWGMREHFRVAAWFWSTPETVRTAWGEMPELTRALQALDRMEPKPSTVASDPITSYFIPAYTHHYAMTPLNQHSSPADERTVERIQDAQGILSPYLPMEETVRLLRKWGVTLVLLNQSFPYYQNLHYAFIAEGAFPLQRQKFLSRPGLFELVYDQSNVLVLRFLDPGGEIGPDERDLDNPYRVLSARDAGGESREELASRFGLSAYRGPPVGGLELVAMSTDSVAYHRDSVITFRALWRRQDRPIVLPVSAFLRIQTEYPHPLFHSRLVGKPFRFWYEGRHRVLHRWGRDREPLSWVFPTYLWEPGAVYRADLGLSLPASLKPGTYDVRVHLHEVPFAPNIRLGDLLRMDDSMDGVVIGQVRIL